MSVIKSKGRINAYVFTTVMGMFFALAALAFFSAMVWLLQLPVEPAEIFAGFALGTGCLAAGITIGRIKRKSGLTKGFLAGVLTLLPIVPVSIITGGFSLEDLIARMIIAALCGMVGGVIGVNRRQ